MIREYIIVIHDDKNKGGLKSANVMTKSINRSQVADPDKQEHDFAVNKSFQDHRDTSDFGGNQTALNFDRVKSLQTSEVVV